MIMMVVASIMVTMNVKAQNDDLKHEVGLYYGFGSVSNLVSSIGAAFSVSTGDHTGFWEWSTSTTLRLLSVLVAWHP